MTLEELLRKYEMSIKKEEFDRIPEEQVKELLKEYVTIEYSESSESEE